MNIVLADIQSSQLNSSDVAAVESQGDDQFSTLIDRQLRMDVQLPPQVEFPQAVEIKGIVENSEGNIGFEDQSLDWTGFLNGEILAQPSELVEAQLIYPLDKSENNAPIEAIQADTNAQAETMLGGVLPLNGNSLPPVSSQATVDALQQETMRQPVPVTAMPFRPVSMSGDTGVAVKGGDDSLVLDNFRASVVSESQPVTKTDTVVDKLNFGNSTDFQTINSASNNANDISSNLFRLHNQPTVVNTSQSQNSTMPPQLETMTLTNPDDRSAVSKGLGDRIQWMVNQKLNTATIRIDPPMLGRLEVQIQLVDDVTNVTINTQHAQTRELIDNASIRLRDYLQENGYENVNVDVSHQEQQASDQSDGDSFVNEEKLSIQDPSNIDEVPGNQYFSSDSVVDYFA